MRHHGGVANACIHGFAPGTCLICQTLDGAQDEALKQRSPARRQTEVVAAPVTARAGGRDGARMPSPSRLRSGPRVVPKEAPGTSAATLLKLAGLAFAVVAVIVVAWTVLHIVFAVLHILELIGVALVAGYVGWVAGVHRGHRDARQKQK
jgi:Flp pilus assembly protein TadB